MKLLGSILFFLLLIFFPFSCSKTTEKLETAEKLTEIKPDSSRNIISKTDYRKLTDKQKALYILVLVDLYDKQNLNIVQDSLLRFAAKVFEKHSDNDRLAYTHFFIGRMYKYRLVYDKALMHYMKAQDLISEDRYLIRGRIVSDIGDVFVFQRDNQTAFVKYKLANKFYIKANHKNQIAYSVINMGKTLTYMHKYEESNKYIESAIKTVKDSQVLSYAYINYGINQFYNEKYKDAKSILLKSITYKNKDRLKAYQFEFLSDSYFELAQYDSARIYAHKALNTELNNVVRRDCYRILANVGYIYNQDDSLRKYLSLYQDYSDSLRKIDTQAQGKEIEQIHLAQKQVIVTQQRTWVMGFFVAGLIIITIIFAIFYRIRTRKKLLLTEQKVHQENIENIQEIIEKKKNTLHLSLKEKRQELSGVIKINSAESHKKFINTLYNQFLHINNPTFFRNELNIALNGMYDKLELIYPELKEKEIQWACLSLLEIPNEDILIILEYNPEAYKKMKQRFARKINVKTIPDISPVLKKIMYNK